VLSLLLLFVDARYRYLESTRSALSVLVSPIQRWRPAGRIVESGREFFVTSAVW